MSTPDSSGRSADERVVVGTVARAHGVRGEVAVYLRTDVPERRFAVGSVLHCDHPDAPLLTVAAVRPHSGRLLVTFAEVRDRDTAEALGGSVLSIDADEVGPATDPDERSGEAYWDAQLVGLTVRTVDGATVGPVTEVLHTPAGELLAVDRDGRELLVPFVHDIVPTVDLKAGTVVIDPPPGLLEL